MSTTPKPITYRVSDYYNPFTSQWWEGNASSSQPSFSADGKLLVFTSLANNIGTDYARFFSPPDVDTRADIYLHVLDSGVNSMLSFDGYLGLDDVHRPGGLSYAATHSDAVVSPFGVPQPNGATHYKVAFVTDSAGVNSTAGFWSPIVSDGSRDIAIAFVQYLDLSEPWGDTVHVLHIDVVEESADVVGAPVFSLDGDWLAYVAASGYEVRALDTYHGSRSSALLLQADAPIGRVSLSHDGNLLAFDTAAQFVDINADGRNDLPGVESGNFRNVFVLDRAAGTLQKVTLEPSGALLSANPGGFVGAFVANPSGVGAVRLAVTSDIDPVTLAPLAQPQTVLFEQAWNGWIAERVSINANGVPVGGSSGAVASAAAAPLGTAWAAFLSDARDMPGLAPGAANTPAHQQAWVGGVGTRPVLLSPGDPASGLAGANADVRGLVLAAVPYANDDAYMLEGQPTSGAYTLAAFSTRASNVFGWNGPTPGIEHIYLTSFRAPAMLLTPGLRVLDYSAGSVLNPLLPGGAPSVTGVSIDVPADAIAEDHNGTSTTTTVTARLGGAYLMDDDFRVLLDQPARVSLGSGDDTLVSSYLWSTDLGGRRHFLFHESTIDGGAGFDAIEVRAGSNLSLDFASFAGLALQNVEALRFDPGTAVAQRNEATLSFAAGTALPFTHVVGSPGVDTLTLEPRDPQGAYTLDLRGLILDGFGDTPPLVIGDSQFNEWLRVSFDVDPTTPGVSTFYGHPDVRHVVRVLRDAEVTLVGGNADDWFDVPGTRPSAFLVDGGGPFEQDFVAMFGSRSTDYDYLAGGAVHGQAVDFRLLDKRFADAADGFVRIELLRFDDGDFTPAQLAARIGQPSVVNLVVLAGQGSAAEGTPPQLGGTVQATLVRSGDLASATTVSWRLLADTERHTRPASADDIALPFGQVITSTFQPGQSQLFISVPLVADNVHESDESFRVELTAATLGTLGPNTTQRLFIVNDDRFDFSLSGAAASTEATPYTLTITPNSQFGFDGADEYRIDWGDGSARQTVSAAAVRGANGQVTHTFADGAPAPGHAINVTVTAIDAFYQSTARGKTVAVIDVAPTLDVSGPDQVEHGASYVLQLGAYSDPGVDPLQQLRIDWGDGTQSFAGPGTTSLNHGFAAIGSATIQVYARNDDGEFLLDTQGVRITASAGQAPANGTAAQWTQAWTDALLSYSHKANYGNAAETWTAATLSAINSGVLAGGDIFGGLLGVSGRSLNTSTVRQEIDGSEALRIELAPGTRANALVLDVARLFTSDAPGLNEAGRVLFFDGAVQVGAELLLATQPNGQLHLEWPNLTPFTSVVFQAGAIDENSGGAFVPGGMVNAQGGYVVAPTGSGSDFLLQAVQFLNLPAAAVQLSGLADEPMAGFGA